MSGRNLLFVAVLLVGIGSLCAGALRSSGRQEPIPRPADRDEIRALALAVDRALQADWTPATTPAPPAPDLAAIRRLALALAGTIPSIEEIRRFEGLPEAERIDDWTDHLLSDRRVADSLAERWARALVGTEDGPFIVFRRRRFAHWLADGIIQGRPFDQVARELIAGEGLWTDQPETNFVTVTFSQEIGRPDPERLAARVSRAFLGSRLDCAQCHDHPFQPWKQSEFRGLAAFFGRTRLGLDGLRDGDAAYHPADPATLAPTDVDPCVPTLPELLPSEGPPRSRLAAWVVDPRNPRFGRATANRMWAVMFGRPLVAPVDDLPPEAEQPAALGLLADDFVKHGHDLRRLVRVIAATRAFRRDSASGPDGPSESDEDLWAAFPMTRLRPEQVAGAVVQAGSLPTIGGESSWLVRLAALTGRNDFVRRYGDLGEDEFDPAGGTIPQRLLLMNGDLVEEKIKDDLFNASSRIAELAPTDAHAVEVAYLAALTRRPTPEESEHFAAKLAGTTAEARKQALSDLFWALLNATEFSWNH